MPEITIGGDDDSGGGSPAGGIDILDMIEQLEEAQEKLMENPQLAKMMGVDLEGLGPDMSNDTNTQTGGGGSGPELTAEYLTDILGDLCRLGYEDTSLGELHEWVKNNPDRVEQIIDQHA